jgi:hypothetical protein
VHPTRRGRPAGEAPFPRGQPRRRKERLKRRSFRGWARKRTTSYSSRLLVWPCIDCTDPPSGESLSTSRGERDSSNSSGTNAMYLCPEPARTSAFVTPFAERLRPRLLERSQHPDRVEEDHAGDFDLGVGIHDAERAAVGCDEHIAWLPVRLLGQKRGGRPPRRSEV